VYDEACLSRIMKLISFSNEQPSIYFYRSHNRLVDIRNYLDSTIHLLRDGI